MLFLVVSFVLAGRSLFQRGIISLVLAFAVEVSQLYHAPWIDGIRSTTLGGLVLGFGRVLLEKFCLRNDVLVPFCVFLSMFLLHLCG